MRALVGFCYLSLWFSIQVSGESNTYRGAVVEYHPVLSKDEEARVASNVENYITFMKLAKDEGADIIVFPENGLLTNSIQSPIPDPADKIAPCDSTTFVTTKAVKSLSCASKNNGIYSVVNLVEKRTCSKDDKDCPPRGYYIYNTNVGFDRKGVVVARYSKFNTYDEPLNKTKEPEMSIFETDFNVRFGMFTCFDILFPAPALKLVRERNITDFIYTTHWYSELPFLTALQMQRGWAETNNVNLLASGMNYPLTASFGSGIFNGKFGELIQIMPEVITSRLLVADIPKKSNYPAMKNELTQAVSNASSPPFTRIISLQTQYNASEEGMELLRDHMQLFQSEIIETGKRFERKICSGDNFCCDFRVSATAENSSASTYTMRAIVFNGIRKFGLSSRLGVQCCGVVLCKGPDIMNCTSRVKKIPGSFKFTEIQLKGDFQPDAFQMPSTLTDGERLEPLTANKYDFKRNKKGSKMEVSLELLWPVTNLQAFGIWGRDFTKDMKSSGPVLVSSPGLCVTVVLTFIFGFSPGKSELRERTFLKKTRWFLKEVESVQKQ